MFEREQRSEFTSSAIFGVIFIRRGELIFSVLGACPVLDAGYQDKKNNQTKFDKRKSKIGFPPEFIPHLMRGGNDITNTRPLVNPKSLPIPTNREHFIAIQKEDLYFT